MRFSLVFMTLMTLTLVTAPACGDDDDADGNAADASTDDGAAAPDGPGDFKADYRTSNEFFTRMNGLVKGTSPHGSAQIWYSSNIEDLIARDSFTAPEGTVSIKEFDMDSDGDLDGIAVMIKKAPGYDTEHGDWYYDMRDLDGNIMPDPPAGKIDMCISCHAGFKATDYFGGTKLK